MAQLIAFAGLAGAGKSTAAEALVYYLRFERVRMAGTLKAMAALLGLTHEQIDGAAKEVPIDWLDGVTPRHIMQTLGTEWGRDMIHKGLWTRVAERKIRALLELGVRVVIDDIRFPNEVDLVHRLGGKVYRIQGRPPALFTVAQHASEKQDFEVDGIIDNDGDVNALKAKVLVLAGAEFSST